VSDYSNCSTQYSNKVISPDVEAPVQKKKTTLSYDTYKNISNMLILYMRAEEEKHEGNETLKS
jgi:hypothetical protein